MRILVLMSSPHEEGSSNLLANSFIKGAREKGHAVFVYDVGHQDMHACRGCYDCPGRCECNGECRQNDAMAIIKDKILNADMVVFVSPLHYYGMSSSLMMVFERFYGFTNAIIEKHLKSIFIAAASKREVDEFDSLKSHYRQLCKFFNFEDVGSVFAEGCAIPEMTKSSTYMQDAYKLGLAL